MTAILLKLPANIYKPVTQALLPEKGNVEVGKSNGGTNAYLFAKFMGFVVIHGIDIYIVFHALCYHLQSQQCTKHLMWEKGS